jgi:hypothetical protein
MIEATLPNSAQPFRIQKTPAVKKSSGKFTRAKHPAHEKTAFESSAIPFAAKKHGAAVHSARPKLLLSVDFAFFQDDQPLVVFHAKSIRPALSGLCLIFVKV